jgi:hypothetical protein
LVPKLRFQKTLPFMKDFLGFLDDNLHNSVLSLFIRHELLFFKNTVVDSALLFYVHERIFRAK